MRKIGILTFSFSSNPGSVLQAYALQEKVAELGYNPLIISYERNCADKPMLGKNVFCKPVSKWTVKKIISWLLRMIAYPVRMHKYERFFKKYYNEFPTGPYDKKGLASISEEYYKFIVGSDQVWNLESLNVDETYFLDFVDKNSKKVSYAASFGQNGVPEEREETISPLINDFYAISVRETEGVKTVKDLTGRDASWVVDPSLLIDNKVWHNLAKKPKERNYVLLYVREKSDETEAFAEKLAKEYNLEVIRVFIHWKCNSSGKRICALGPLEWLGYMKYAKYIVTNSFHGICFSVAFKKEFFVDLLKGNKLNTNTRIEGVLEQFGLSERRTENFENVKNLEEIDYAPVYSILEKRRSESLKYLEEALKGENSDD